MVIVFVPGRWALCLSVLLSGRKSEAFPPYSFLSRHISVAKLAFVKLMYLDRIVFISSEFLEYFSDFFGVLWSLLLLYFLKTFCQSGTFQKHIWVCVFGS